MEVIALSANVGAAARTVGARHVEAEYVAFSDDDSWWAPGALRRAVDLLDLHPRLALVAARILVGEDAREDPTCALMARSPLRDGDGLPGRPVLGFVACGAIVRRSAFLDVGGFHPRLLVYGEERLLSVDLAERGWSLAYVPDVVAHHHPDAPRDDHERERLEARNRVVFAWLRLPLRGALAETAGALRRGITEAPYRAGLRDAVAVARGLVRERRPVGSDVARNLRLLAQTETE